MSRSVLYTSSPLLASKTPVWRSKFIVAMIGLGFVGLGARAASVGAAVSVGAATAATEVCKCVGGADRSYSCSYRGGAAAQARLWITCTSAYSTPPISAPTAVPL